MRVQRIISWVGFVLCATGGSAGTLSHTRSNQNFAPETISVTAPALSPSQPPVARPIIPSNYFGLTVLNYKNINPSLTFGTTRTWDAHPALDWAEANPAEGRYNFGPLNSFVSENRNRGVEVIYTFGRTPQWASTAPNAPGPYGPGQCAPPVLQAWDSYVTAIVTNAAGSIKYWELWNEPDQANSYCGNPAVMVTMAQHAYRIIKNIDSSAVVLSPAPVGRAGAAWLDSFIKAGGLHTFDIAAFHGYEGIEAERIIAVVDAYRAVLDRNQLNGTRLWDTECSWGETTIGDDSRRSAFLSKHFLLQWSKGVDRVLWYAYDGDRKWGRIIDTTGNLLPQGVAYGEVYKWMADATLTQPCTQDKNNTWTCSFARPRGYAAQVVWNSVATGSFKTPAGMIEYIDLSGAVHPIVARTVPVSNLPILLETGPLPK